MTASSGRPPRFSPWRPPKAPVVLRMEERGKYRSSPRVRGLDVKWDRLSIAFRRRHPFCRMCQQEGRDSLGARVDHILPRREFPDLTYSWRNLQSLCVHHDNLKSKLEYYARETGQVEKLALWCESVEARPRQFRPGLLNNG